MLVDKIQAYKHGSVVLSYTPIIFFSKSSSPKLASGFWRHQWSYRVT